jgi:hypothetical protein
MTKYLTCSQLLIQVVFILFSKFSSIAQNTIQSTVAEHFQTSEFDAAIFPENSIDIFPGKSRFTPTHDEVKSAEMSLINQLKELNSEKLNQHDSPVIDKNLKKYKRQYFGYIDENGNKILFINCFWRKEKEESLLWLKERIRVLDGGSYFWNIKFNVAKMLLFDLEVNGEA